MSTVRFVRKGRREVPRVPGGEISLQAPPEIPRSVPGGLMGKITPAIMVVSMIGMVAFMWKSGNMTANPTSFMFPLMMLMSMVGMVAGGGGRGAKSAEINEDRKDYLRYLTELRNDVADTAAAQRASMEWSHPHPHLLWTLAGTMRMWERRAGDPDYFHVRVGLGGQRLATRLVAPETGPVEELEPIAAVSLRRFVRAHAVVDRLPTAVAIRGFAAMSFEGDKAAARAMVRAMMVQLCTFHGPDQLLVAMVCGPDTAREWSWLKWLPHVQHPLSEDGAGSERMCYGSMRQMLESLRDVIGVRSSFSRNSPIQPGVPQLVIIIDGGVLDGDETDALRENGADSICFFDIGGYAPRLASTRGLQIVVQDGKVGARAGAGVETFAEADGIDVAGAQQVARRLAPYRAPIRRSGEVVETEDRSTSWARMLSLGDIGKFTPDADGAWKPRTKQERLRVPVGWTPDGSVMELDIKESAENGMGPHGLCIGATGSGKSEFLRTLVASLLATHSPEQLNLVLVDFKGGATFLGMDAAPHVSAVITNLEGQSTLVERMHDALTGEMDRRQNLLATAGASRAGGSGFKDVTEYESARVAGADLEPLPALFIIIDEFSELLSQQPEFADDFAMIGRLGRSLHVHLLLASQRLEEGKLRGLDSHLSYRIGLKTFSANESRSVIGVPDAYHLPGTPGAGYLKSDAEITRFQAAYVSGNYVDGVTPTRSQSSLRSTVDTRSAVAAREFTAGHTPFLPEDRVEVPASLERPVEQAPSSEPAMTNLEVLLARIAGRGREAHKIWLPPLDVAPSLDQLVPRSILTGEVGFAATLRTPIGLVDRPRDQRRDPYMVELHGSTGNVAVVGGPQTGKSTAIRTLIMSMALTHTPEQVQFYCLDFGGGTLAGIAGLPHVGSVAGRWDADRVRRTIAELKTIVRRREERFRAVGIESMAQFRQLRTMDPSSSVAAEAAASDPFGDVFLVVDGYGSIRQDFEPLEQSITNLAVQGLSYGVHVIISAARWGEVRPALKDQSGTRIELRLGDPADSDLGRRIAMKVPEGQPGRGMTLIGKEGLHTLTALPRVDGSGNPEDLAAGVAHAVAAIEAANRWQPARLVRLLPDRLARADLLSSADGWESVQPTDRPTRRVPIGIDEAELAPVYADFDDNPHFVVFGDIECGKTTLLRNIVEGIVASNTPEQARIVLADFRINMLDAVPASHLSAYARDQQSLTAIANSLAQRMRTRLPGSDITAQQLRERSWWSGPEVYLVVDDYDMVASSMGNPLTPLLEFLSQGKDIGFHVLLARRSGGAGRSMYETFIARLGDLATPGVVMSGSKDEGALIDTVKPAPMPPGRGILVGRSGSRTMQVPWLPAL